jgi:hypothetical protein
MEWQTRFVFASLFFLLVAAIAEPVLFLKTHQQDLTSRVLFIGEWMPVARDVQFLGFVACMVFGVSLVKLGSCLGFQQAHRSWGVAGFALWVAGVAIRCVGWVVSFESALQSDGLYRIGTVLLGAGAVCVLVSSRVLEGATWSPSTKFVRAAYCWLVVAAVMMAVEPVHLSAIGVPFSHAYTGAIRHAVTVGFISQMIIGVGAHVVNRMRSVPEPAQARLLTTFFLLNVGNAGRVGLEVATDYSQAAFLPMGATGFIELTAILLWGIVLLGLLLPRRAEVHATC